MQKSRNRSVTTREKYDANHARVSVKYSRHVALIFIVWGFVDSWIGTGRIEIDGGTLRWQRGILGMGPRGEIGKAGIRELLAVAGSRVNNSQRYAVVVVDSFGRRRKISRELRSRRAADTLIAELRRALA